MNTIFLPKPSAALSALKGQDANSGLSRFQPQRGRAHSSLKSPCVPVDRSSGGSVRTAPQPSLAATAARLGHSLVSSDGSYVTYFPGPSERNSSSLCCSRLLLQHCGVYLSVCIWSIVESLSVAWWEPCLCVFTQLHGHAHPLFPMGQPKPLREAPPAGGGWRGLCCDHDRPWLWQMAKRSIIGISAAACNCKRSI